MFRKIKGDFKMLLSTAGAVESKKL